MGELHCTNMIFRRQLITAAPAIITLAVLLASANAAHIEDIVVPESGLGFTESRLSAMTSASSGSTHTETYMYVSKKGSGSGSGSGSIPITAPTNVVACGKEWPTAEFKEIWNGYCSGDAYYNGKNGGIRRYAGYSIKRPFEGSQSFALDSTCSVGSPQYSADLQSGKTNVVVEARSLCTQKHGQMCKTFDVNRNKCFGCFAGGENFDPPTGVKNSWEEYCKTPGKTTFAMSGACGQTAWASGENANEDALVACNAAGSEQCFPFDFNGEKCPVGPDAHDLRPHMPSCLQVEPDWCWATGVTEITRFFGDSTAHTCMLNQFGVKGTQGTHKVDTAWLDASAYTNKHCGGIECLVVGTYGRFDGTADPWACCKDRNSCSTDGGGPEMEAAAINYNMKHMKSGQRYAGYYPVHTADSIRTTQSILNKIFAARKPVIMNVGWLCGHSDFNPTTDYPPSGKILEEITKCGGHAVTLAGMDGMGRYYLHDPMNRDNNYQALTMSELVTYSPPEFNYNGTPASFAIPSEFLPLDPNTHCGFHGNPDCWGK